MVGFKLLGNKDGEVIFIDVDYPELGQMKENTLYVNKTEREIAIYDSASESCVVVSNYTDEVTDEDIENLFK